MTRSPMKLRRPLTRCRTLDRPFGKTNKKHALRPFTRYWDPHTPFVDWSERIPVFAGGFDLHRYVGHEVGIAIGHPVGD